MHRYQRLLWGYAQGAVNVQKETFQQIPVLYDTDTAMKIEEEFQTSLPLDKLQDRRKWRDSMLAGLAKFKSDSNKEDSSWCNWFYHTTCDIIMEFTVITLSFRTDRSRQTMQTQIDCS